MEISSSLDEKSYLKNILFWKWPLRCHGCFQEALYAPTWGRGAGRAKDICFAKAIRYQEFQSPSPFRFESRFPNPNKQTHSPCISCKGPRFTHRLHFHKNSVGNKGRIDLGLQDKSQLIFLPHVNGGNGQKNSTRTLLQGKRLLSGSLSHSPYQQLLSLRPGSCWAALCFPQSVSSLGQGEFLQTFSPLCGAVCPLPFRLFLPQ